MSFPEEARAEVVEAPNGNMSLGITVPRIENRVRGHL